MRDGTTKQLRQPDKAGDGYAEFCRDYRASLVVIEGAQAGRAFPIDRPSIVLGRGPAVDAAVTDPSMSRQHATLEYEGGMFRLRDLGSTNGIVIDGSRVDGAPLLHGDRFRLGSHVFQLVIEEREEQPEAYTIVLDG